MTYTPINPSLNSFEKEAMQIFNQVTANKNRILKKNSDGTFYTRTTVKTRKFDANGKEIIENFEATSFGGLLEDGTKVGEVVQKYSNEKTGVEKASLQRFAGEKLRRYEVKKTLDFESTHEYLENFDHEFEKEWKKGAKDLGVRKVLAFERKLETISPKKV
jgi:RNA-splicing ligase RtcB